VPDFQYLTQNYFSNPNYLRINGRPVVFLYLTRAYFNAQSGRDAVANLRQTMTSQFGVNPYLIGRRRFSRANQCNSRELVGLDHGFRRLRQRFAGQWRDHGRRQFAGQSIPIGAASGTICTRWFHPVGVTGL